jgi:predicted benzoate:H+ symporter BenE
MPQNQLIGFILMGVALLDTIAGHYVIAPRVPDEKKRAIIRFAFTTSGVVIAGLGFAFFKGFIGSH